MDKNTNILHKYTGRTDSEPEGSNVVELDAADDLGAFGWLRGGVHSRAIMLDLRKRDGNRIAIGYSWIAQVALDPSIGITISAMDRKIILRGRNLNVDVRPNVRLYDGLLRHRVLWIQEAGEEAVFRVAGSASIIETISW